MTAGQRSSARHVSSLHLVTSSLLLWTPDYSYVNIVYAIRGIAVLVSAIQCLTLRILEVVFELRVHRILFCNKKIADLKFA